MSILNEILYHIDSDSKIYENEIAYSYKELIENSENIASILRNFDEKYVILKTTGSFYDIATILAIWKSGKVYVPVMKDVPNNKLKLIESIIIDCKVVEFNNKKMFINNREYSLDKNINTNNLSYADVVNPNAYVIFTSGTTGVPKGVPISHSNLEELFNSCKDKFNFDSNDVWINFHALSFDFSIWEIFGPLTNGASLVLLGDIKNIELDKVSDLVISKKVTVLNQTPSVFSALSEYLLKYKNNSLRYLIFGGEKLSCKSIETFYSKNKKVKFINMYGITEVTVHATYHEVSDEDFNNLLESNIGLGLQNDNVFLVDENKNKITSGEGEIVVCGSTVSEGYLNKNLKNKINSFEEKEGIKRYYSGDIGKYNERNEIIYIGRRDTQIEKNGYRIELGEIKDAVMNLGIFNRCEVDFYKDQIICYYKCNSDDMMQANIYDINKNLLSYIEEYKLPNKYCLVDEFYTNENGKIDINKLRNNLIVNKEISENVSFKEWVKRKIANNVGIDYLNIDENRSFIELGLTSLQMINLHKEIVDNFTIENEFSVIDLFQYKNLTELYGYLKIKEEKILCK
ncbi:non-ribosomal peptide synthetase [Clostridium paraputrificum]|uniref:non-ribosomal peptide synthetase n=1 Tax=Clostridium paraputrificum TaxID=29363 RepID=UPI003D338407